MGLICVVVQDYSVEGMSESLLTFLQHLREFGLVFQRKVRRSHPACAVLSRMKCLYCHDTHVQ